MKINKNTTIENIVMDYPELIIPLREYGITCILCGEPVWGTLKENAEEKNIAPSTLTDIINHLNEIIS